MFRLTRPVLMIEIAKDQPQGALTSFPFKVTQPWATFLVGGGASNALGSLVPEPTSLTLVGLAAAGLMARRRRR